MTPEAARILQEADLAAQRRRLARLSDKYVEAVADDEIDRLRSEMRDLAEEIALLEEDLECARWTELVSKVAK